jgi:hypothetical protein
VPGQAVKEFLVFRSRRGSLTHHHDIQSMQIVLVQPKRFANDSLQAITLNCEPTVLFGNRQSQPRIPVPRGSRQDGKQMVAAPIGFFEDPLKSARVR